MNLNEDLDFLMSALESGADARRAIRRADNELALSQSVVLDAAVEWRKDSDNKSKLESLYDAVSKYIVAIDRRMKAGS